MSDRRPVMIGSVGVVIALLLLCSGCGSSARQSETTGDRRSEPTLGAVIPESLAAGVYGELGLEAPTAFWTPERGQAAALEASLARFLAEAAPEGSRLRRSLDGYEAQYIGLLEGEREVIFANFFCDGHDVDVTRHAVAVDDGGDCYFTVIYDPATDSFERLSINGES